MGISEDAFWSMLPREFTRRVRVHARRREEQAKLEARREENALARTVLLVNHVRAFGNVPPIDLDEITNPESYEPPSREQWERDKQKLDTQHGD